MQALLQSHSHKHTHTCTNNCIVMHAASLDSCKRESRLILCSGGYKHGFSMLFAWPATLSHRMSGPRMR